MSSGEEARRKCPEIQLVRVPERRGKADLTCYREVGAEVIRTLSRFTDQVERASVDEAYLDITSLVQKRVREGRKVEASMLPATHVAGGSCESSESPSGRETDVVGNAPGASWEGGGERGEEGGGEGDEEGGREEGSEGELLGNGGDCSIEEAHGESRESVLVRWLEDEGGAEEQALAVGAVIAAEMRAAVWRDVGCTCSAGIAHNKVSSPLLGPLPTCSRVSCVSPDAGQVGCRNAQTQPTDHPPRVLCACCLLHNTPEETVS